MSLIIRKKITLLVSDMAGTIINEKGIIYNAIEKALTTLDYSVDERQKATWPGRDNKEVLYDHIIGFHSLSTNIKPFVDKAEKLLLKELEKEYFENSQATLIPGMLNTFDRLRLNGVKIALSTGYPKDFQKKIIESFRFRRSY